jgi:hypothetical protein
MDALRMRRSMNQLQNGGHVYSGQVDITQRVIAEWRRQIGEILRVNASLRNRQRHI